MRSHSGDQARFKRLRSATPLCAVVAVLLLLPLDSFGTKPFRQPTLEEVAQVWVGLSEDELYLFRLDLHPDGTGTGGFVFVDGEATLFRISKWSYVNKNIELVISPSDSDTTGISTLRGEVVADEIEVTMYGKQWKRRLSLRPEAELERRWLKLRAAMSSAAN